MKPSARGRAAAHHANTEFVQFDQKTGGYVETERVSEYALGKVGEIVPVDGCRILPANALVRWDVHYYPTGEELKDDVIEMGIWLYPEDQFPKEKHLQYLYILAQLQELNGERADALASYRRLRSQLGNERGTLVDGANAAIKRLSN